MNTFIDPFFWLNLLYFFIVVFVAFYIPGQFLLRAISFSTFQRVVLGTTVGMVMWGLLGFLLGYLHFRDFLYFYICSFVAIYLYSNRKSFLQLLTGNYKFQLYKVDFLTLAILLIGTIMQLLIIWFNGTTTSNGIYFCCGLPDSIYHTALTNELTYMFPPSEPGLFGVPLKNYHFLTNLIIADIVRVFHLPLLPTFSQYFPLFITILMATTAIVFGELISKKKTFIRWLLFFLFFSGDILYIFIFLLGKGIDFDMEFVHNAAALWISISRVVAIPIFFTGMSLLTVWTKSGKIYTGLVMAMVFGTLISIKTYVGVFVLAGTGILGLVYLLQKRFTMLLPLFATVLLSGILYIPISIGAGGLVFTGFWRFENFIVQPQFQLERYELARLVYVEHKSWLRVLQYELTYIFLYFVFTFGTLMVGIFQTKKSLAIFPREINIFLLSGITTCLILGSFFIQKTGGANSVQFLITMMITMSIYTALACSYWIEKIPQKLIRIFFIICIVLLTVPRSIYQVGEVLSNVSQQKGYTVSYPLFSSLIYIKKNIPQNNAILVDNEGLSLRNNCNSITIFSHHQTFFCDGGAPKDRGIDTFPREIASQKILTTIDPISMSALLKKNNIQYMLISAQNKTTATVAASFTKVAFRNDDVVLLEIHEK